MGGFRELAALAPNGVNGVGTSDALLPAGQLRSLGKRRRTGVAQMHASGSETFESLRGAYEGFDVAAGRWLAAVAEREAAVTVREAACCGVEAQLNARSNDLSARSADISGRERRLADWDARLRDWDARLQQLQTQIKDQEERLHYRMQPFVKDKENSTPEDTDSDLDVTGGPGDADMQLGGSGRRAGGLSGGQAWPPSLSLGRYWDTNTAPAVSSRPIEQQLGSPHRQPNSPTLHIAPLSCGLHITRSGADGREPDAGALAGSDAVAAPCGGPAASAESPSECSAGAAAMFSDDGAPAGGHPFHRASPTADALEMASPKASPFNGPSEVQQHFMLPLFQQQQQQQQHEQRLQQQVESARQLPSSLKTEGGQWLESLAEAAEEVERRAGSAAGTPTAARPRSAAQLPPMSEQGSGVFAKTLDYKSCDHIMCLTKDMARHLFPQPPHTNAGGPTQMSVELEDDSGRMWPMTYRCVPHRYSYELRAGWKAFAAFWSVGVGDMVMLWREPLGALRISVRAATVQTAGCPAAGTRGRPLGSA